MYIPHKDGRGRPGRARGAGHPPPWGRIMRVDDTRHECKSGGTPHGYWLPEGSVPSFVSVGLCRGPLGLWARGIDDLDDGNEWPNL